MLGVLLMWAVTAGAQVTEQKQEVTVPAEQSPMQDVLLDPWSEVAVDDNDGRDVLTEDANVVPDGRRDELFYIDMQLRGRGEYRNGQGGLRRKGDRPAWFVNERTRLAMGYQRGILSARISGQHAGVWGNDSLTGGKGIFALNEAWARLDAPQGWFLQVGRQQLAYDDERIFGLEDWHVGGYAHNAVRLGFENSQHRVHGIVAFNQNGEKQTGGTYYRGPMPYKNMQFLWYHFGNEERPVQFSLMGMNRGFEMGTEKTPETGYMQMMGGWFQYRKNGIFAKAEGYYQMGHDEDQRAVSAYLGGLRVGYEGTLWGATLGGDYVSGQKSSLRKGTNKCFNLLYGSVHEFYGAMDYYMNNTMLSCGLVDGVAKAYVCPTDKWRVNVDYHYFLTGVKRKNLHRQLGQEIDLSLRYKILKDVTLEAGYSMMMPTSVLVYFRGGNSQSWQDWGWLSINFTPRLFSSRK